MIRLREESSRTEGDDGDYYPVGVEFKCPACGGTDEVEEVFVDGPTLLDTFECVHCDAKIEFRGSVEVNLAVKAL